MNELDALVPIRKDELKVGSGASKNVYDSWGNLLLASGVKVDDQDQLDFLIENGYCADPLWESVSVKPAATAKIVAPEKPAQEQNKETVMLDLDSVRWYVDRKSVV